MVSTTSHANRTITDLVPVVRELPADLETPVSVFLKLADQGPSFLLESVTGGEQLARYSFIGLRPRRVYVFHGENYRVHTDEGTTEFRLEPGQDPLTALRAELASYRLEPTPGLPRFIGGLVGYLGYEAVRFFEPQADTPPHAHLPDGIFFLADTLVAFDHAFGRIILIANTHLNGPAGQARDRAEARLDQLQQRLQQPLPAQPRPANPSGTRPSYSNKDQESFAAAVRQAQEHIRAGDIFQVVLSQRLDRETHVPPFDIYRALRRLNPSPYMFYFDFGDQNGEPLRLIGASPEMHVRLEGRQASVRPIAGTRPRGLTPQEDQALEAELLSDPKERAEHVMLVDLARNDLGRVCRYGSLQVPVRMVIERYSHVMHIVSHVEGELQPQYDAFDLMRATFPAGTVSGAPKIRAMQIINDLEGEPRGPYAGAVGYFSFDGSMDTCITIRSLTMQGHKVSVQAGAGIVADSAPDREYAETLSKAHALAEAVDMAEGLDQTRRGGKP